MSATKWNLLMFSRVIEMSNCFNMSATNLLKHIQTLNIFKPLAFESA